MRMDDTAVQQVRQNQEARPPDAQMVPPYAPLQAFFLLKKVGFLRYSGHKMLFLFEVYSFLTLTFAHLSDPSRSEDPGGPGSAGVSCCPVVPCLCPSAQSPEARFHFIEFTLIGNVQDLLSFCLASFTQLIIWRFSLTFA